MKLLKQCVADYFLELLAECGEKDKLPTRYLRESILEFLENPSEKTADEVYNSFFDVFRMRTDSFAFFDLLDALRSYELQTSSLTKNQRDHFVHSVWVFIMGLSIFGSNKNYREAFGKKSHTFLHQWGLTSLLHDIGYPIEITFNQFKQYVESMIDIDGNSDKPEPYFEYGKMDELLYMHDNSEKSFIDLLAENISEALGLDAAEIAKELYVYPNIKGTSGYIDHAFYSSIMMTRWNGILIEKLGISSSVFEDDIINAASAILLHNYYKRPLQMTRNLPPLSVNQHPLAFMIILCDELQEWDRAVYGKEDKNKPIAEKCEISLSESCITVNYGISVAKDPHTAAEEFSQKKIQTLTKLIRLSDTFPGIKPDFIKTSVLFERCQEVTKISHSRSPRPLLEDLESVARIIHENYRKKYPNSKQGQLSWDECDDHFRYDNISQARHLYDYITKSGYTVHDDVNTYAHRKIDSISETIIEDFAIAEHDRWMKNKINDGWRYGELYDTEKKLHPSIIPYADLSEGEKDKDRAPLVEFVETLKAVGKILVKGEDE